MALASGLQNDSLVAAQIDPPYARVVRLQLQCFHKRGLVRWAGMSWGAMDLYDLRECDNLGSPSVGRDIAQLD